ncbi:alpha/beta hydrolase [Inhella proteolytica]|uniref:Alpha/beta hydrolase n=1 Tax=Inhella proteolytica TaxID=2795029 RepID=A0A931J927_9BURK|nr:alpha/beta hydrolase-fold protein [Inhella proteolytica]MBH9578340.1 alpha/beta hydrolase [Inhella proteolytica]
MQRRALLGLLPGAAWAQTRLSTVDRNRLQLLGPWAMPGLGRQRGVRVYLPPSYLLDPSRQFPVIYFHDGQNVFDEATSYAGEWGADETLDRLAAQTGFEAIAVAIDHGGEQRLRELNPWDQQGQGAGEGWAYLRFIVEVVKPLIDARFRTQRGAAHTAMVGSSMGGLITHAALHRHREVFGLGAVFSPSFWVAPGAFDLPELMPLRPGQRIYLYAGTEESPELVPQCRRMAALQRAQGAAVQLQVTAGAGHNEAAWRKALPMALYWLFELG